MDEKRFRPDGKIERCFLPTISFIQSNETVHNVQSNTLTEDHQAAAVYLLLNMQLLLAQGSYFQAKTHRKKNKQPVLAFLP